MHRARDQPRRGDQADQGVALAGSDGSIGSDTAVEPWLSSVEDFPDRAPVTLFLLDLCHSGTAARLGWQLPLAGEDPRAWVTMGVKLIARAWASPAHRSTCIQRAVTPTLGPAVGLAQLPGIAPGPRSTRPRVGGGGRRWHRKLAGWPPAWLGPVARAN